MYTAFVVFCCVVYLGGAAATGRLIAHERPKLSFGYGPLLLLFMALWPLVWALGIWSVGTKAKEKR